MRPPDMRALADMGANMIASPMIVATMRCLHGPLEMWDRRFRTHWMIRDPLPVTLESSCLEVEKRGDECTRVDRACSCCD